MSEYELSEPLKVGGGEMTSFQLREPTAIEMLRANRHIENGNNPEADILFARELIAGVSGLRKPELLSDLDGGDLLGASDAIIKLFASRVDGFDPAQLGDELELAEPVNIDGIEIHALAIRSAKTGEMLKARGHLRMSQGPASQLNYQMALVSSVTGISLPIVHRLPASAVVMAAAAIEVFTQPGRRTGSP